MKHLFYSIIITAILSIIFSGCTSQKKGKLSIRGTKIYTMPNDPNRFAENLADYNFNTVLSPKELLSDSSFNIALKNNNLDRFLIFPVFYAPEILENNPEYYAITNNGEKAVEEWVHFACPSSDFVRNKRKEGLKKLLASIEVEAVSIDFIRHFSYWEKVYPERTFESLPNTCFCDNCIQKFQADTKIIIPDKLNSENEVYQWLLANHQTQWINWKCDLITSMVKELSDEAKRINPEIKINLHAVPWRDSDFESSIKKIISQDFTAISEFVDYISPMTYSHMVKQPAKWINDVVIELDQKSPKKIIPSIQVSATYLSNEFTDSQFKTALEESLKDPSLGVIFYNWEKLEEHKNKLEIIKSIFK